MNESMNVVKRFLDDVRQFAMERKRGADAFLSKNAAALKACNDAQFREVVTILKGTGINPAHICIERANAIGMKREFCEIRMKINKKSTEVYLAISNPNREVAYLNGNKTEKAKLKDLSESKIMQVIDKKVGIRSLPDQAEYIKNNKPKKSQQQEFPFAESVVHDIGKGWRVEFHDEDGYERHVMIPDDKMMMIVEGLSKYRV